MYKLEVRAVEGKNLRNIENLVPKAMDLAFNDALHIIRMELMKEAPVGNRDFSDRGQMHIVDYLSQESKCVRRTSRWSGYVFFNTREVPHIKYIVSGARVRGKEDPTVPKIKEALSWPSKFGGSLSADHPNPISSVIWEHPGFKSNDFIKRAYLNARGSVYRNSHHKLKLVLEI